MRRITKDLLKDCSAAGVFRFSLCCAECGRKWENRSIRFSKAGIEPETEGKRVIYRTLYEYEREKETARQQAAADAAQEFNLCPICGRLVCDGCFLICDDLDMCTACAEQLQEQGAPVLRNGVSDMAE